MFFNNKVRFNLLFKTHDDSSFESTECSICYDEIEKNNIIKTDCNHIYCIPCFKTYIFIKSKNINTDKIQCPYCRQHVKMISLDNEEEQQFIMNEYCSCKSFNIFEPSSVYVYTDLYYIATTGDIYLEGDFNTDTRNDIIVIYPIIVSIILFIYACIIISIDNNIIKQLIKFLGIVLGTWYLFYSLLKRFYEISMIECYFMGWVSLCIFGTILIIYT